MYRGSNSAPARVVPPVIQARASSRSASLAGSSNFAMNEHDSFTAAWLSAVKTDGGGLAPHLIPAKTPRFSKNTGDVADSRVMKTPIRTWMVFRRDCYVVIASFLLGIAVALILFQK
jgi:hypothetical protein